MKIKKYKVFTLSALALLVTSILLIGMNVPTSAKPAELIHLHGPSLMPVHMHSKIGLINLSDPLGTPWHALYPEDYYCQNWTFASWEDNGNEYLDSSDQIDMINDDTMEIRWYHVDRVTMTMRLYSEAYDETIYVEFKGPFYEPYIPPVSTNWTEVWPVYGGVTGGPYHIVDWVDQNGYLDVCDYVLFEDWPGIWWHVEEYATDLVLNEKISDPVCTYWHELYPECCVNDYHIEGWEDNGDKLLSPCDNVTMTLMPGVSTDLYHIEEVTLTLNLTIIDLVGPPFLPGDRIYIELLGGYKWMYYAKTAPLHTDWEVVCPADYYGMPLTIEYWDDDCNGVLSYCDIIELLGPEQVLWCHIDEVAIDIVVTKKPVHDVAVIAVSSLYPKVDQGQVDPIYVTVENQGDFNETVDVYAFYDGNLAASKQTIILNSGQNATLIFNWNTTGVPLGTYTISGNATIPIDDDPFDNYLQDGTQEVIPEFPPAIILPLFMILSLIAMVFKLKKKK